MYTVQQKLTQHCYATLPQFKEYVCGTADYPAHMTSAFLGLFVLPFSHPPSPPPRPNTSFLILLKSLRLVFTGPCACLPESASGLGMAHFSRFRHIRVHVD